VKIQEGGISWWLDWGALPDRLIWARLDVAGDGSAVVFDMDGKYHRFPDAESARLWLMEDEYSLLAHVIEEGEVEAGVLPPSATDDERLLPLMCVGRKRMPLPFHVSCAETGPLLYELADDRFEVMTHETVTPFVAGYQFLLVENSLADFLKVLEVQRVTYRPATIVDPRRGEERRTHTRVVVQHFFRPSDISDIAVTGLRIYSMGDEYYFVSPALKAELEKGGFPYLRFSEGLSGFVAG
jgi:hypothetical protein